MKITKGYKEYASCPNFPYCAMCGTNIFKKEKITLYVGKYDKHKGQSNKKLCALCIDCYAELLEDLELNDV